MERLEDYGFDPHLVHPSRYKAIASARLKKTRPGTAALNAGGIASVGSVSCASAGNCSAGGSYLDSSGHGQAFVVSQN